MGARRKGDLETAESREEPRYTRRRALAGASSVSLAALVAACGGDGEVGGAGGDPARAKEAGSVPPASGERSEVFAQTPSCRLTPEQTEGPFYFDAGQVRRDIREDREGTKLQLFIGVRDAGCEPLPDAVVEVWHADARGAYSGFPPPGENGGGADYPDPSSTYLRGTQVTDREGIAEFVTIYPGPYPGRTPHIHVRIHPDGGSVLSTQLYLDDGLSDQIYGGKPYPGAADRVTNGADGFFDPMLTLTLSRAPRGPGFVGSFVIDLA